MERTKALIDHEEEPGGLGWHMDAHVTFAAPDVPFFPWLSFYRWIAEVYAHATYKTRPTVLYLLREPIRFHRPGISSPLQHLVWFHDIWLPCCTEIKILSPVRRRFKPKNSIIPYFEYLLQFKTRILELHVCISSTIVINVIITFITYFPCLEISEFNLN